MTTGKLSQIQTADLFKGGSSMENAVLRYIASLQDREEIVAIENKSFQCPLFSESELKKMQSSRDTIIRVAELDLPKQRRVIGFVIYRLHEKHVYLLDVAVSPEFRRQGLGKKLLEVVKERLFGKRRTICVDVRETNAPACNFFRANHFRAIRVIRKFFENNDDDAYRMIYTLPNAPQLENKTKLENLPSKYDECPDKDDDSDDDWFEKRGDPVPC